MTPDVDALIKELRKLPGVGRKTATRYAYALLSGGNTQIEALAEALRRVAQTTRTCGNCYNWTDRDPCALCCDRDGQTICVVEQPGNILALERGGGFRGQYHVLRGLLNPIEGVGLAQLTIDALVTRVRASHTSELILALSPTREGEATSKLIATMLADQDVRVSRLAFGVPLGGQLEHLDEGTLSLAMAHRRSYPDANGV